MAKRNIYELVAEQIDSINMEIRGASAPAQQETQQTAEAAERPQEEQQTNIYLTLPVFRQFNVEEARRSILDGIKVEEVRQRLAESWASSETVKRAGRKAVGELGDYVRTTAIMNSAHITAIDRLCRTAGYTKKEALEFLLEVALTVLKENGVAENL